MNQTEGSAGWNMATQYYEMLQAFMGYEAQAYAENDLRELWKWLTWLYDNVSMAFDDKTREALDEDMEVIDEELFKETAGDKINDLYDDGGGDDLKEYRKQLKQIRTFRRRVIGEMHRKKMITPWSDPKNLGKAGVTFDAN